MYCKFLQLQKRPINILSLNSKIFVIDGLPILVQFFHVVIDALLILEIFLTGRAMVVSIRTKVDVLHVLLQIAPVCGELFSANRADKPTVTGLKFALQQVFHS